MATTLIDYNHQSKTWATRPANTWYMWDHLLVTYDSITRVDNKVTINGLCMKGWWDRGNSSYFVYYGPFTYGAKLLVNGQEVAWARTTKNAGGKVNAGDILISQCGMSASFNLPAGVNTIKVQVQGTDNFEFTASAAITVTVPPGYTEPSKPTVECGPKAGYYNMGTVKATANLGNGPSANNLNFSIYSDAARTHKVAEKNSNQSATFDFSGLQPNTRYYVRVTASNGYGTPKSTDCYFVTLTGNTLSAGNFEPESGTLRVSIQGGGGVYPPNTTIRRRVCGTSAWTENVASTNTKNVANVTVTGLSELTCYEFQACTVTTAGTYCGNTVAVSTPEKHRVSTEITKMDPKIGEAPLYETTAEICYDMKSNVAPVTSTLYYRVKDSLLGDEWTKADEFTFTNKTGSRCVTLTDLFPNQTVYEVKICSKGGAYDGCSPIKEFITPLMPKPENHNCENFDYLVGLLCQAIEPLKHGIKTIFANQASKEVCDPDSDNPTLATLWSRLLRFDHAAVCLLCDMIDIKMKSGKDNQYYVGELGWVDMIKEITDDMGEDLTLASSDAIRKYIDKKIHEVWHMHGEVGYLVGKSSELPGSAPNGTTAIVSSLNEIWVKQNGTWKKDNAATARIDDFAVYHVNNASNTSFGVVAAQSAYYQFGGKWQNLDADTSMLDARLKVLEAAKPVEKYSASEDSEAIRVVNRDFNFNTAPCGDRTIFFVTEPTVAPPVGYHKIYFSTGPDATIIQAQDVMDGALAQEPITPKRPGYVFDHWNDQATNAPFNWNTPIKKDYNLEAVWRAQPVTVSFDINGATGTTPADIVTTYGSTITLPSDSGFSKTGATFNGWLRDGVPFTNSTPVVGDTTLVADWQAVQYTVTYKYQNGQADTVNHVDYGDSLVKPADPVWADHVFMGWFDSATGGSVYDFTAPIYSNKTIYAQWKNANYTVSFNSNGGSAVAAQTVAYGQTATEPANPTKSGYTFAGWYLNGVEYDFATPVTSNITLDAQWASAWTVSFDMNGGNGTIPAQTIVNGDYAEKPLDPTRDNATFVAWYNGNSPFDFENTPISSNVTLKARWNFTITFDANGGAPTPPNQTVMDGGLITKPTDPTKTGYDFLGWVEDNS